MPYTRSHGRSKLKLARRALPWLTALLVLEVHASETPVVLQAMQAELERSMDALAGEEVPPYFLSYEITELRNVGVSASFGALTTSGDGRRRGLDVDLRVGDYKLDNTRQIRGARNTFPSSLWSLVAVPVEDDVDAIRSVLWRETDRQYKRALEQFTNVETNVQVKVEAEDQAGDFSQEQGHQAIEEATPIKVDRADWEAKVERYSEPFSAYGEILGASARLSAFTETRWFVNSDGAAIQTAETIYRLFISASTKAADGMELPLYRDYGSFTPDGLPDDETVARDVATMIDTLLALREAPVVEPYTGPAILSGTASGVFFHEILGHRVEGHRQKLEDEGQTFKTMRNERVLPENFSVFFDPTQKRLKSFDLVGSYRYDNQGVAGRRVAVIDKGVLKNFLMSRMPIDGFPNSNGHGRKQMGYKPVARQSNLIVHVENPLTSDELKARLIAAIKAEGKPFGLRFVEIQGGFTITGRTIPNSFNVTPLLVYRVYPDGREELVRGVDLIGTPLTTFSRIVAGDDQIAVFNGTCGAESGGVPVAAASPGILVSQIEVQKKSKSQERAPLLPAPIGGQTHDRI